MREKTSQEDMRGPTKGNARQQSSIAHKAQPCGLTNSLLNLQRTHGNQFVQRLLLSGKIQAKLTVSEPGDQYEQEADHVADQIMRMPDPDISKDGLSFGQAQHSRLQRMCSGCEEEEKHGDGAIHRLYRKPTDDEEEKMHIQTKGEPGGDSEISSQTQADVYSMLGGGQPLHRSAREFFEPRFQRDFSQVRIHTDERASSTARALNAHAYTVGSDIVFGAGKYAPDSDEGRRLLAHELTHVVQQRGNALQRLTITQHGTPTKGACGEKSVEWVFELSKAAACDGYIVQQLDNHVDIRGCDKPVVDTCPANPTKTFWEAWFVKKGDKVDWTTVRDGWTDGNSRPGRPSTSGCDVSRGAVKFFCSSTTGDLGDFNKAGANKDWAPGKEPLSHAVPSTLSKPSWWDSPVEGPATRFSSSWWNCCGDRSTHFSHITFHPKP